MNKFNTYIDLLEYRANLQPNDIAYTYIHDDYINETSITYQELSLKVKAVASYLQKNDFYGKRALLLYTPSLDFIISFLGCLYSGVIAVPAYPPEINRIEHTLKRIESIIKDSDTSVILTTSFLYKQTEKILEKLENTNLKNLLWVQSNKLDDSLSENWESPLINENTVAFLQYTSGSTSTPKGVIITHKNLLHNEEMLKLALGHEERKNIMACWVPFYHDMGLIGHILQTLYIGSKTIIMSPISFLKNPYSWLNIISKYNVYSSGAPNFAFDLCVKRITKEQVKTLDLSNFKICSNAAEPIRKETIDRFSEYFKESGFKNNTHRGMYGLAEATVFVSISDQGEPIYLNLDKEDLEKNKVSIIEESKDSLVFVSCGKGRLDEKIYIVNPETKKICKNDEIGEIWVSGLHISQGYWNLEEETEKTFKNYIKDKENEGQFLRTGDLGFIHQDNLYITGRIKDLIIINGRNIYPQDIEKDIEKLRVKHKSIRLGCNAVFAINNDSQDKVVIFQEIDDNETNFDILSRDIVDLVNTNFEIPVENVVLLKSGTIAKTSSGKIMRQACKRAYINNYTDKTFKVLFELNSRKLVKQEDKNLIEKENINNDNKELLEIQNWIKDWITKETGINDIDINKNFFFYGFDSILAVSLITDLEKYLDFKLYETILWDYKDIKTLSEYIIIKSLKELKNSYENQENIQNITPREKEFDNEDDNIINENDIAIIGMSCRFPNDINTPEDFWHKLNNKIDCIKDIPKERWDNDYLVNLGKTYVKQGGFLNNIDMFEPEFFSMSKKEAIGTDPQQRLLLELSWEALENSGIVPSTLKDSNTGVFTGIFSNDYSKADINSGNFQLIDQYSGIGNALSVASGRISYTYGLQGTNITIDTACSSSLVAIHLACQNLISGDSDLCLAGGVNLILSPDLNIYSCQISSLSPDSRCKTFDNSANGYVRSEGVGFVVLKKLSKAIEDKNNILAVIKSTTVNHDGASQGLTAPNGQSQIKLLKSALKKSNINSKDISFIETHGTGTNLGDPIELRAIDEVFNNSEKIILGAVKSNIGHLESAAGIAGVIKTILALKNKKIPANIHFNKLNTKSYINESKFIFPTETIDWNSNKKRRAFVNSFGISGTNSNIVLEEYNDIENIKINDKKINIINISAQTDDSLLKNAEKYLEFISKTNESLYDISYTANNLKTHFDKRISCVFKNKNELISQIQAFINNENYASLIKNNLNEIINPKICFVYSGHGSQWIDMAKELIKEEKEFKYWIIEIDKVSKKYINWSIFDFITTNKEENKLDEINIIQPCIFTIQVALSKLLISYGVNPESFIGHSMGEISACFIAGILDLDSSIKIICERSKLMQEKSSNGAMLFSEISYEESLELIKNDLDKVSIAICNNDTSVVLSGDTKYLEVLQNKFDEQKIFNSWVRFNGAAHSYQMEILREPLLEKLGEIKHSNSNLNFYSSVIGDRINPNELDSEYWLKNLRNTVYFNKSFDSAIRDGFNTFIEISPHSLLSIVMKNTIKDKNLNVFATSSLIKNKDDNFELYRLFAELYTLGLNLDWNKIYPEGKLVFLPNYQWNKSSYWKNIPSNDFSNKDNNINNFQEEFIIPDLAKDWLYEIQFKEFNLKNLNNSISEKFLVFADNIGLSDNFKIILDANKQKNVFIYIGNEYKKINEDKYYINPENIEDYKKLFAEINIDTFSKIVHFWSVEKDANNKPDYNKFIDNTNRGIFSCINIIKSIKNYNNHRFYSITTGNLYNNYDNLDKNINYNQSPILAFSRVVNYEIPELKFTNIDISYEYLDIESSMIYDEIKAKSEENLVLIRDEKRFIPRIEKYEGKSIIKQEFEVIQEKGFLNKLFSKKTTKQTDIKEISSPEINENSTYLILGGTGGLGLLFTKYLIDNNAKNIVLCSRKGANEETEKELNKLREKANIQVFKVDISNENDVKNLFASMKELPPLKGIIHSALVLNDSSIKTHQKDYFYNVMKAKVQGIINLHNITIDLDLNFFIMFSSLTSILGLKYFTNYASSNAFLDSFSYYRRKLGLPSISINWGPWSEIGQAAYYQESKDLDNIGITNISPEMGIKIFDEIFKLNPVQVIAMNMNMYKFLNYYPEAKNIKMYESLIPKNFNFDKVVQKDKLIIEKESIIKNKELKIKQKNKDLKYDDIKNLIKKEVSLILNINPNNINEQEHFRNYGLDSLMAIDMLSNLSQEFGVEFDNQIIRECPNVESLSSYIDSMK